MTTLATRIAALAGVLGLAVAAGGCGSESTNDGGAADDGILNVVALAKPSNLNPALNGINASDLWYSSLAYAPLIHVGAGGELEPALATDWGYVGEGNTEFQLTIRSDAKFSDGTPLTAKDVAESLTYALGAGGPLTAYFAGAQVTAPDDTTVDITVTTPNPEMPFLLSNVAQIGNPISDAGRKNPSDLGFSTAGAGPYTLDESETVEGDRYTYVPNPNYYDQDAIHYDQVVIKVVSDTNAALSVLRTGDADLALGDLNTAESARSAGLEVYTAPVAQTGILLADRTGAVVPALGSQLVRQALNYAIDRETIAKELLQGEGQAVNQVGTPDTSDYLDEAADQYAYDPDKARELLAEAGYPDGFKADMLILSVNPPTGDVAQAVISDWAEIGVEINAVSTGDGATYNQDATSKKFPLISYGFGYIPFYLYAVPFYLPVPTGFNPFVTQDAELATLVQQANAATGDERQSLIDQANQRAIDLAWIAPVTSYPVVYYASSSVGNIDVDAARALLDITEVTPAG